MKPGFKLPTGIHSRSGKKKHAENVILAVDNENGVDFFRLEQGKLISETDPAGINHHGKTIVWRASANDLVFAPVKKPAEKVLRNRATGLLRDRLLMITQTIGGQKRVAVTKASTPTIAQLPCRPLGMAIPVAEFDAPCVLRVKLTDSLCLLSPVDKNRLMMGWTLAFLDDSATTAEYLSRQAGIGVSALVDGQSAAFYLAGASKIRAFPTVKEWFGLPIRQWAAGLMILGIAFSAFGLLEAAEHQVQLMALKHQSRQLVLTKNQLTERLVDWDRDHVHFIARHTGLDLTRLFNTVLSLWIPGSTVSIQNQGHRIVVQLPRRSFGTFASGQWAALAGIRQILSRPVPAGWIFKGLYRGDQGVFYAVYQKD